MKDTQSFRLAGTTEIQEISIQHVDEQSVIYWESIKQVFSGARQAKNGDVAIPRYIKYSPGMVLNDVSSSATEYLHADSRARVLSVIPTVALATTRAVSLAEASVGLKDARTDPSIEIPGKNKFFEGLQVATSSETPVNDVPSTGCPILQPSSNSQIEATSDTAPLFKQAAQLALKKVKVSDTQIQLQELRCDIAQMIWFQKASDAKQEEIKQLQKRALEGQEKIEQLQEEVRQLQVKNQEELRQMHIEAMGQLAVLQSRVQAILIQTFELHEYPIPRLFIVLLQNPAGWDAVNPFSNKFRLYFLCECGEHTKLANSKTRISHHIHLAKHEGYEINRPSEFFRQYGSYVLTILKMPKLGVTVAGVVVPALSQLISSDAIGQSIDSLKTLQRSIVPGVDQIIEWMDKNSMTDSQAVEDITVDKGEAVERVTKQIDNKGALEGADLRKPNTFLQDNDENKVLGNLHRTVTVEGHVKWVCIDHYRESYQEAQTKAFQRALDSVGGSFYENSGLVTVKLRSGVLAEQFYSALGKARSVLELDIDLDFECTKSDLERLEDALKTSSASILRLDHQRFRTSIRKKLLSQSAFQFPAEELLHLQKLSLEMVLGSTRYEEVRILTQILKTNPTLVTWHLYKKKIRDNGARALSEVLKINSTLTTLSLDSNSIGDNGAQALSDALKNNSTLTTLNLTSNSIGDNGVQALSEALKINSTLTTLNLSKNSIGRNGAQALSEALKINSTLTTLQLSSNSIGDSGARALSRALKTNSNLTDLVLWHNSIGDNGGRALSEVLRNKSTPIRCGYF
ncbi:hypothetical protein BGZ99_000629 [Dissophora globulifera]|uniref:RNI-like protein n=1 Tax=Dissophora globulifera TaxID=979702 RepID=A0A9P6R0E2_9FUNG|nr:hypothetical protein BGZ99_000629 [Dissophora globulifera]